MDTKKMILSTLAGFVAMFALAYLWHVIVMGSFYDEQFANTARAAPQFPFIVLAYLVLAILMAYIYPIGYKGGTAVSEGIKFGILIGLLSALPSNLVTYGVSNVPSLAGPIVDAIWHVLEQGVGGIVVALVYGRNQAPAAS